MAELSLRQDFTPKELLIGELMSELFEMNPRFYDTDGEYIQEANRIYTKCEKLSISLMLAKVDKALLTPEQVSDIKIKSQNSDWAIDIAKAQLQAIKDILEGK